MTQSFSDREGLCTTTPLGGAQLVHHQDPCITALTHLLVNHSSMSCQTSSFLNKCTPSSSSLLLDVALNAHLLPPNQVQCGGVYIKVN